MTATQSGRRVTNELILDLRPFEDSASVRAENVVERVWPVASAPRTRKRKHWP